MVILSLMVIIIAIALTSVNKNNSDYTAEINIAEEENNQKGNTNIYPIWFTRITSIVFLFSGVLSFNTFYIYSIGSGLSLFNGLFVITPLSQAFDIILFTLAGLIIIPWGNINQNSNTNLKFSNSSISIDLTQGLGPIVKEFSLIVLFTTLGGSLLLSSNNLLSLYLSLELQSFGVYILSSLYRDSESSTNAGLKYFLLGGLSSCIILLGCVFIYSYTGTTNLEDINSLLLSNCDNTILQSIQLGLILIFIGFLFKIAAAPFHNWAPDVYNDVPSIITIWLTIMPKIAILILTVDILNIINLDKLTFIENIFPLLDSNNSSIYTENLIKNLFLISSFLSLLIGTIVGLAQTKIKRLLAYSTISHIGFILLALSVNTEQSLESILFYLIQYSFTNLNIFFIILALGYQIKNKTNIKRETQKESFIETDINFISELKGEFKNNPLLTLSLAICLFSMAGIPPLLGFFAKAGVLYSSIQNGYYFISLIAIIVSVISAYYYLTIIKVMHFDSLEENNISLNKNINTNNLSFFSSNNNYINIENKTNKITNIHSFIIANLTLIIIFFILKPSVILNSIHILALNIFYF